MVRTRAAIVVAAVSLVVGAVAVPAGVQAAPPSAGSDQASSTKSSPPDRTIYSGQHSDSRFRTQISVAGVFAVDATAAASSTGGTT
jgi:hypothetical protein